MSAAFRALGRVADGNLDLQATSLANAIAFESANVRCISRRSFWSEDGDERWGFGERGRALDIYQAAINRRQGESVMELLVEHVDVWAAPIPDRPGGLAEVLGPLRDAGANLQSIIARRAPGEAGEGVAFVTPLQGDREIAVAGEVGFNVTHTLHSVRVMGRDRPGIAAELVQKLADAGINLRGFSASVIGTQFVAYAALDSQHDANRTFEIWRSA